MTIRVNTPLCYIVLFVRGLLVILAQLDQMETLELP